MNQPEQRSRCTTCGASNIISGIRGRQQPFGYFQVGCNLIIDYLCRHLIDLNLRTGDFIQLHRDVPKCNGHVVIDQSTDEERFPPDSFTQGGIIEVCVADSVQNGIGTRNNAVATGPGVFKLCSPRQFIEPCDTLQGLSQSGCPPAFDVLSERISCSSIKFLPYRLFEASPA